MAFELKERKKKTHYTNGYVLPVLYPWPQKNYKKFFKIFFC